jgi:hypothetical protein
MLELRRSSGGGAALILLDNLRSNTLFGTLTSTENIRQLLRGKRRVTREILQSWTFHRFHRVGAPALLLTFVFVHLPPNQSWFDIVKDGTQEMYVLQSRRALSYSRIKSVQGF